jgi:hypothetical protein
MSCSATLLLSITGFIEGCKASGTDNHTNTASGAAVASHLAAQPQVPDDGLPAESTGGFDGKLAYGHVAKQVSFGPRPSGSQAILQSAGLHYIAADEFELHRGCRFFFSGPPAALADEKISW